MAQARQDAEELEADLWEQKYLTPINNPRFPIIVRAHDIVYAKCSQLQYTRDSSDSDEVEFSVAECEAAANLAAKSKMPTPFHKNVIVILGTKVHCVPMTREQMTNYQLYLKAVKEIVPNFDSDKRCAWQCWTSVRNFWMEAKMKA
jgi:hypothetical protein